MLKLLNWKPIIHATGDELSEPIVEPSSPDNSALSLLRTVGPTQRAMLAHDIEVEPGATYTVAGYTFSQRAPDAGASDVVVVFWGDGWELLKTEKLASVDAGGWWVFEASFATPWNCRMVRVDLRQWNQPGDVLTYWQHMTLFDDGEAVELPDIFGDVETDDDRPMMPTTVAGVVISRDRRDDRGLIVELRDGPDRGFWLLPEGAGASLRVTLDGPVGDAIDLTILDALDGSTIDRRRLSTGGDDGDL